MPEHKIDRREEYYWSQVKKHGARYPAFDWPSVEAALNLTYTFDVVNDHLSDAVTSFGITRAGFNVLRILSRSPSKACKQNEISQLMLVSRANITGLVDSLSRKGLVERISDPYDRRVNRIKLLPKGEKLLEDILPGFYKIIHDLCKVLDAHEKKIFNELLVRLRNRAREIGK
ncbi:MAG: MarR family transcriptional regulator [Candidatus Omnitrophica bacterium]|nr:MarR family transcriptional regulator [Candidatus Omnitrophota bacterium]MDE2213496.1 MarR family transcriptional regulator [Candidatus Omnitrophota bacterium]